MDRSDFATPVEVDRPFKHLQRVFEASSPLLDLSQPTARGVVIHEPVVFTPTVAASSGRGKFSLGTKLFCSVIFVYFPGNLMDLTHKQWGELLQHLGTVVDVASVAQYSFDQTHDVLYSHMFNVRILWIFLYESCFYLFTQLPIILFILGYTKNSSCSIVWLWSKVKPFSWKVSWLFPRVRSK